MTRCVAPVGLFLALACIPGLQAQTREASRNDPVAAAVVERAISRMGGEAALRGVKSLRLDVMTQWRRTNFSDHPSADRPSYERNVELRDYETRSWRNTRTFLPGTGESVDVVRDTVGARRISGPDGRVMSMPLNIAYIDERRELFGFAPERLLLLARDSGGLRALGDTTIAGVRHARVATTIDRFPATIFLNRADGLPAMVRFRADEDNDFGLAPWGVMDVEVWFTGWSRFPPGVLLPRQRDVHRVGRPYKRMTVLAATINAPAPADSFAIADSLVAAYHATQRKPMWDTWADSAAVVDKDFVTFPPLTGTLGAVRIGGTWVLMEAGQSIGATKRVSAWFAAHAAGTPIGAAIVTHGGPGSGGAAWLAGQGIPVFVAPSAAANMQRIVPAGARAGVRALVGSRWVRVGTDSLWLEVVDIPDFTGVLAIYSPTHRWLMSPLVIGRGPITQPEQDSLIARLRGRGLPVEWLGSVRTLRAPVPR
jgi:hypothetical protein